MADFILTPDDGVAPDPDDELYVSDMGCRDDANTLVAEFIMMLDTKRVFARHNLHIGLHAEMYFVMHTKSI